MSQSTRAFPLLFLTAFVFHAGITCGSELRSAESGESTSALRITQIALPPRIFRSAIAPKPALPVDPLPDHCRYVENSCSKAIGRIMEATTSYPADWKGIDIDLKQIEKPELFLKLRKERKLRRASSEAMCLLLEPVGEQIKEITLEYKRVVFNRPHDSYDDDDILPFGNEELRDEAIKAAYASPSQVRVLGGLAPGEHLLCPLYLREELISTDSREGLDEDWRLVRGEVWIPIRVTFKTGEKTVEKIEMKDLPGRLLMFESDQIGAGASQVQARLDGAIKPEAPHAASEPKPQQGSSPDSVEKPGKSSGPKFLFQYVSMVDMVRAGEDRRKNPTPSTAFLDYPLYSSGVQPPEEQAPVPHAEQVVWGENETMKHYRRAVLNGHVWRVSVEPMSLVVQIDGGLLEGATLNVKRIKLKRPLNLFRSDRTFVAPDYVQQLIDDGEVKDEKFELGPLTPAVGMIVPLFIVSQYRDDGDNGAVEQRLWNVVDGVVIVPVSITFDIGNGPVTIPVRRMKTRPWFITSELVGRG